MFKIDPYRPYKTNQAAQKFTPKKESGFLSTAAGAQPANTDRLDISAGRLPTELEKTAAAMARTIASPASEQRLAALREEVQSGSYHRPTEELVDAIVAWGVL